MTAATDSNLLDPSDTGCHWASRLLTPFLPPIKTIRHYNIHKLRRDVFAGLTVSVVEVPQSMAYALIAGVPAQYGLYTSVLQGIVGAMLSSSEHMTTGPTNTQSLLIASAVHRLVNPGAPPEQYLAMVFALTMLKGLIQLGFAAASMGNMVRYVSRSVIAGLVSGAGVLIFVGQLPPLLGLPQRSSDLPGVLGPLARLFHQWRTIDERSIGIGLAVVAIVIAVRRISKLLPGALIAIVLSGLLVWARGWTSGSPHLLDALPHGFPHFQIPWPGWKTSEELFGGALALAVIGMLESVAIAKSIAAKTGEEISANQEFFAQGLKNFITSFFQCIPGSGSFTRSALDYAAGAETRFAAVFNACFVGCIFWLLADQAHYIPRAALAGVLIVIAAGLIEWSYIPRVLRASRADATVCLCTFSATLIAPLEYAIFIGVFLNIGLYLRTATRLHIKEIVEDSGDLFQEREIARRSGDRALILLQIDGDLFFPVCDELSDRLNAVIAGGVRVVIFRLRQMHSIDATAMHVLETFIREMRSQNRFVLLCGLSPRISQTLRQFGLLQLVGEGNTFAVAPGVFGGLRRAIARAEELLGHSVDSAALDLELDEQAWLYEI